MRAVTEEEIPEDRRQAAVDAKRFLEDPTTVRVLGMVLSHYRKQLEESEPDAKDLREHCYHQLAAVREFHRQLTKLASQGRLEERRRTARNGAGIS